MSLHVIVLLYPHGAQERGCTACVRSVLLSGWSGCRAVSAAVRPLCAVGLSGSCQAVTLGPDSDGSPLMSGSAVRLSDTCCQAVRESAVNAVRLSGTVRRCPGFAVRLSDQGSDKRQERGRHLRRCLRAARRRRSISAFELRRPHSAKKGSLKADRSQTKFEGCVSDDLGCVTIY